MVSLSHDITLDVLSRLGVKDLLRFRCVSKAFCCSIDDPDFIELHLSHSLETNTNLSLVFSSRETEINLTPIFCSVVFDSLESTQNLNHPLHVFGERKPSTMMASCNGLLAFCDGEEGGILVWNPSTRKCQILPSTETECPRGAFHYQSLGLGYDPVSDDYKLVRIIRFLSFISEVKVFSFRANTWRRIKDFPFFIYRNTFGVLANNALHWCVSKTPEPYSDGNSIAAFDVKTEEYRLIELPGCFDDYSVLCVKAMGGCLCLAARCCQEPRDVAEIWMMKEYGVKESWIKLISSKPCDSFGLPVSFSRNGDRVLLCDDGKELMWYDMTSERFDQIRIGDLPSEFGGEFLVESLVPLNDNAAMINKEKQLSKEKRKQTEREENFHLDTLYTYISDYRLRSIIIDVLCRLGTNDLLRFRCVSKLLCSLIDDPSFIKFHLFHSLKTNSNLSLILQHDYLLSVNFDSLKKAQKLNYPLDEFSEGKGTKILGSCCDTLTRLRQIRVRISHLSHISGTWHESGLSLWLTRHLSNFIVGLLSLIRYLGIVYRGLGSIWVYFGSIN